MPKIERLEINNFRSLNKVDLELRDLNVLIGPNGSGKSNLVSFFRMIHSAAQRQLGAYINGVGGYRRLKYFGAYESLTISTTLTISGVQSAAMVSSDQATDLYYRLSIAPRGQVGYLIDREQVERPPVAYTSTNFVILAVEAGTVKALVTKKTPEGQTDQPSDQDQISDQDLAITQIQQRTRYPVLYELQSFFSDFGIYQGFGIEDLRTIRAPQQLISLEKLRLRPNGDNLISVFYELREQHREIFDELVDLMKQVEPDLERFVMPIVAGGTSALYYRSHLWRGADISVDLMSDGQLRFLALAIILLLPDPPAVLVIEEPEIGLHPEMIPVLAGLLKRASGQCQIIVTTHSPQLLNAPDIELDDIILVDRVDGASRFDRPSAERLNDWLKEFSLGELWVSGTLEHTT